MIDEAREKGLYEGLEKRMLNLKKAVMMVAKKTRILLEINLYQILQKVLKKNRILIKKLTNRGED